MAGAPRGLYPSNPHPITVVFDADAPEEAECLQAFKKAFGEEYARVEGLDPLRYRALHLFPGGHENITIRITRRLRRESSRADGDIHHLQYP